MLTIKFHKAFKQDFKRMKKQGADIARFEQIIDLLVHEQTLPPECVDHPLKGTYQGYRDCHITLDWILIYKIERGELLLILHRTGSHSELFR